VIIPGKAIVHLKLLLKDTCPIAKAKTSGRLSWAVRVKSEYPKSRSGKFPMRLESMERCASLPLVGYKRT